MHAVDQNGNVVNGVNLTPDSVEVKLPITLLGGYRNVIVKVVTSGVVASGYKLTSINATPPNVVVFSGDPQQLADLPGFIETKPVDLTAVTSDITTTVPLNMPSGISVVNDQKAVVHIGVNPIIGSVTFSIPVSVIGLGPGLEAQVNPTTVNVALTGPVAVLNALKPTDISVVLDMTGKDIGNYQVAPDVLSLPSSLSTESISPSPIEVTLVKAPTATHTPLPTAGPSPTQGPSQLVTPAPTRTPTP